MALEGFGSKQERLRLAQFYAALSDGELQELFGESGSLTEEARTALASEMSRRNLPMESPAVRLVPGDLWRAGAGPAGHGRVKWAGG